MQCLIAIVCLLRSSLISSAAEATTTTTIDAAVVAAAREMATAVTVGFVELEKEEVSVLNNKLFDISLGGESLTLFPSISETPDDSQKSSDIEVSNDDIEVSDDGVFTKFGNEVEFEDDDYKVDKEDEEDEDSEPIAVPLGASTGLGDGEGIDEGLDGLLGQIKDRCTHTYKSTHALYIYTCIDICTICMHI